MSQSTEGIDMHRTLLLIAAVSLAAAPAVAQNEVAAPPADNAANEITAPDVNAMDTTNVTNVAEPVPAAPIESDVASEDMTDDDDDADRGFPWGLIGLVGLVGLLGRRRNG